MKGRPAANHRIAGCYPHQLFARTLGRAVRQEIAHSGTKPTLLQRIQRRPSARRASALGDELHSVQYAERCCISTAFRVPSCKSAAYLATSLLIRLPWLGALLVLVAAVTYAIHLVLVQWFLRDYGVGAVATYIAVGMTAIVVGTWLAQGAEWHDPGWQGWLAIGALAVVGTYLAHLAMLSAIRGIGSGQTALLAPLETLLAVLWSILLLHERLTLPQWLGGSLIGLSALLAVRRLRGINWRVWLRS